MGVHESPRRLAPGVHPYAIHAECITAALADAGLTRDEVDGFCTVASFPSEAGAEMALCELVEYLGLQPRWVNATDLGGAAFLSHAGHAALAISAGLAEVVVVSYAALGRSAPVAMPDYGTTAWGPGAFELPHGFSTVASYALAAQRHAHVFGTTAEQLARIAVQCRANAAANPDARFRDPITVDDVLASAPICTPLHLLDCCVVTDSGAAFVLTSAERARALRARPVQLLGFGEAVGSMHMSQVRDFTTTPAAEAGQRAFATAGLQPDEIDCAQLYDSFTITVLLTLEALGFCGPGEGGAFVDAGNLAPGGALPINTDGGGLSSNHPGRRGAIAIVEAVRQLRGSSAGVQLDGPATCLVNGTGGFFSTAATLILGT